MSLTELGTIWLVRDFPPLFLFAQPDSWMAANWGQGSLAAAAESNALMPLTLFHSLSLAHTRTHSQKNPRTHYQPVLTYANFLQVGQERREEEEGRSEHVEL